MSMILWWFGCGPHVPVGEIAADRAARPVSVRRPVAGAEPLAHAVFEATIAAGSAWDPIGREGTAFLAATGIGHQLEAEGRTVTVIVDKDAVRVGLTCTGDQAARCAEALGEALVSPVWDDVTVSHARAEAQRALTVGSEEGLADAALDLWLFRGHPYGHAVAGRLGVLATLDAGDLRAFHAVRYTRATVDVAVAGDAAAPVAEALEHALRALAPGADPLRPNGGDAPLPVGRASGVWILTRDAGPDTAYLAFGVEGTADLDELWAAARDELQGPALVDELWLTEEAVLPRRSPVVRVSARTTGDRVALALDAGRTAFGASAAVAVVDPATALTLATLEPPAVVRPAADLFR